MGARRSSAVGGVGRRRHRSDAERRGALARRPRSVPAAAARRRHARARRSRDRARATTAEATRDAHRPRPRRDLSRAARPVRRRRHRFRACSSWPTSPYVGCGVLASAVGMDKAVDEGRCSAPAACACPTGSSCARREWHADRDARRSTRIEAALPYPLFVKPANLGSSVGISKVHDARRARRRDRTRRSTTIARSSSKPRCRTRARSSAPCSATTRPRRRCPARSCRRASSTTTKRSTSTAGSRTEIPAPLDDGDRRRGAAAGDRRVRGDRRRRTRARRLSAQSIDRRALRQRDQHACPASRRSACIAKMWAASGVDYPTLVDRLIALALERHAEKQQLRTSAF